MSLNNESSTLELLDLSGWFKLDYSTLLVQIILQPQHHTIQCNTIKCITIQNNTMRYTAVPYRDCALLVLIA